jgi:nitrous oxidase accessory protein NosD
MRTRLRLAATLAAALVGALAFAAGALAHGRHYHGKGHHFDNTGNHESHGSGDLSGYGSYGEPPHPPGEKLKLFVSASGTSGAPCSFKRPCKTIAEALAKATPGSSIIVLGGEYHEEVAIAMELKLIGVDAPTINAAGMHHGIELAGPATAGSRVKGFKVVHANEEGILALSTHDVTIAHNEVRENDLGNKVPMPEGQCKSFGEIPGDCGEGVHLMGTSHARVFKNLVIANAGGILLTDETGPTAHNWIAHNDSVANVEDCGITLAGHNPEAFAMGKPQPSKGGIFDNKIVGNIALADGILGGGAGILLASPVPGGGVYDNLVQGNSADESGLPGITLHSHAPGQDLNGNRFIDNQLANNGKTGNEGKPGDAGTGLEATAGIIIFSAVTKLEGIVVKSNKISKEHFGIWTKNAPPINAAANTFTEVEVPLFQS